MSIRDLWTSWNGFWFAPESALSICVFRILFGVILLIYCALLYPDLLNWYGTHGICSASTSGELLATLGPPGLTMRSYLPPGDSGTIVLFWVIVFASVLVTLGWHTKISTVCVYLGLATLQQQNSILVNGADVLLKMSAFYLVFAPAACYLSLDCLAKKKHRLVEEQSSSPDPPGWTQRLFRLQIALIYFQAFWTKLADSNWLNGSAVYYVLRAQDFLRFPATWISGNLWACHALTWGTLVTEGAMWSLIWFKETRYIVLSAALLLHLGMEYTMNITTFQLLMMASLVVFVPSEDLVSVYKKLRATLGRILARNRKQIQSV